MASGIATQRAVETRICGVCPDHSPASTHANVVDKSIHSATDRSAKPSTPKAAGSAKLKTIAAAELCSSTPSATPMSTLRTT